MTSQLEGSWRYPGRRVLLVAAACMVAALPGRTVGLAVLFFVGYGKAFGHRHVGKIQGTAQAIGVVASSLGPKLLGSYWPAFRWLGFVALGLTLTAWYTPMPNRNEKAV